MRAWTKLRLRLRSLFRAGQVDRELEEELRFHSASAGEEARSAGADAVREACRDQRGVAWIENLLQDARRALRRLAASPGFTLTAVVALAFGVAAATAIFSLCDAVLVRPLPGVDDGRGLVHLERWDANTLLGDFSYPDYLDYRDFSRSYTALAASSTFQLDVAGAGGTDTVNVEPVSGNFFAALGVRAEQGRLLTPGDEPQSRNHVVVVSDRFWRSGLNADPRAVGRTLIGNRTALTIVGVAAPGFQGATQLWSADLWVPITAQPSVFPMGTWGNCLVLRNCGWVTILGRLAPGVTLARSQTEADLTAARIAAAHPEIKGRHATVVAGLGSWSDDRANQTSFLEMLLAGTLLLVAMTCASLGSLFLARMGAREHEAATQLALGASRGRVARQYLLEAGWVAVPGAAVGCAAATPAAQWLLRLAPTAAPRNLAVSADGRMLVFAVGLAVFAALAMALAPALLTARGGSVSPALQQGGRSATAARHRAQRGLLALQLGLALVLLIAAGLAARTLQAATAGQVSPAANHTVLAMVDTGHASYTRSQTGAFYDRLHRNLAALPGMTDVALTACLAPAPCSRSAVFVAGTEPPAAVIRAHEFLGTYTRPDYVPVSPEFFPVFGLPLVAGRNFSAADRGGAPLVCVINQSLAAKLWPGQSALGQRVAVQNDNPAGDYDYWTVVGIVADRRTHSLLEAPPLALYFPAAQMPSGRMWIAAQTSLPTAAALAAMRTQVAALEPRIPLINGRTLADEVRYSLWQPIAIASLAGLFGSLAALMAAIGLFGTLAQFVHERRRELGVRLVLGATPGGLVRGVVAGVLAPIGTGLALGGLAAAWSGHLLLPWMFGVSPGDPFTWLAAAALLAAVALAGATLAAARAARLRPLDALRCE